MLLFADLNEMGKAYHNWILHDEALGEKMIKRAGRRRRIGWSSCNMIVKSSLLALKGKLLTGETDEQESGARQSFIKHHSRHLQGMKVNRIHLHHEWAARLETLYLSKYVGLYTVSFTFSRRSLWLSELKLFVKTSHARSPSSVWPIRLDSVLWLRISTADHG